MECDKEIMYIVIHFNTERTLTRGEVKYKKLYSMYTSLLLA